MKKIFQLQIENYENSIRELIGKSIISVNYYDLDYEIDCHKPYWDKVDYHSLDYGLEIRTNDNQTYYFIWDSDFLNYNLKFVKDKIEKEFSVSVGKHLITSSK